MAREWRILQTLNHKQMAQILFWKRVLLSDYEHNALEICFVENVVVFIQTSVSHVVNTYTIIAQQF